MTMHPAYRRDIDGLRALAVLAVVFFHAGVPGMGGGFTGVDMFFVISGYLITDIIRKDLAAGTFSMWQFYERRLRRIFPSLMMMFGLVTLAACLILMPEPLRHYGQSMVPSSLFGANIHFHGKTGYFDGPAADKPLLHIWSLAVEEQFYLGFPLLLMGMAWLGRTYRTRAMTGWLVAAVAGVSLLAAQLAVMEVYGSMNDAFYLVQYRAWELGLGALLVLLPWPVLHRQGWREGMAATGLLLLIGGIAGFTAKMPFPGLAALVPCVGTALVIGAGRDGETCVARMLGWRPVVLVGLVSYPLYLWHWPLLVLAQQWYVTPVPPMVRAGLMTLALGLAVLCWKYVEMPVRTRRVLRTRRALFGAALLSIMTVAGAGAFLQNSEGWPQRLPENVRALDGVRTSQNPRLHECFKMNDKLDQHSISPATACTYGASGTAPTWVLWGDSHADALVAPLGDVAKEHGLGVAFFGMSGCPPLDNFPSGDTLRVRACADFNRQAMARLRTEPALHTVVLMARWDGYVPAMEEATPTEREARLELFRQQLMARVQELQQLGKRVILVEPVPEPGVNTPEMLARLALRGDDPASFTVPLARHEARSQAVHAIVTGLPPATLRIDPEEVLCNTQVCHVMQDGKVLYYDDHHLSLAGGALVAAQIVPLMQPGAETTPCRSCEKAVSTPAEHP